MKFAIIALVAFAAVSQGFVILPEQDGTQLNGNIIDTLIREALEFIRKLLTKYQPYTLPPIPQQKIVDTDVDMTIDLSNVQLSNADNFVIEHIENNLPNLWAKFDLLMPSPQMTGTFDVEGTAFQKTVSGKGTFTVHLVKMDQSGFIQMEVKNHGLQIKNLTLDYDLSSATFNFDGLNVSGMTHEQVEDFLNKHLLDTLNKNKAMVCQKVAAQVMTRGNQLMAGKTLKQLIEWLKNFIHQ